MRYAEFEKNVDALRRKRIKRLGVRYKGSGQRAIYAVYSRGTRKFSGDLALWMQYIEFARQDKAYKRLNEIITAVVRLHPTKAELWIYAAHYFMDSQADITNARSYMQRGLRFCKTSELMWLEYAKLETIYVAKIAGRRRILGLDQDRTRKQDDGDDMIALPEVTAEDVNPSLRKADGVDDVALQNLASAPVLTGAIPIAVFDSAMKQFDSAPALAEDFFSMFAEFDQVPCIQNILEHVLSHLESTSPKAVETYTCRARLGLFALHPISAMFPSALGKVLEQLSSAIGQHPEFTGRISEVAVQQMVSFLLIDGAEDMDPAIQKVLHSRLRKYARLLDENSGNGEAMARLVERLQHQGKKSHAQFLAQWSLKQWPANVQLQQLRSCLDP